MEKISIFYTDSYDGVSSRDLLKFAASICTGISENEFDVCGERGEKPYFSSHPNLHFSISHSGKVWAVAFARDEVGLDVQILSHGRNCEKMAGRFFSENEAEFVRESADNVTSFTQIWSRKEALVKLYGIGIDSRFRTFDATSPSLELLGKRAVIKDINLYDGFAAAVAYGEDFRIETTKI